MKQYLLTLLLLFAISSLALGCGGPPDTGNVGPIGPVGPKDLDDTTSSNLTVIENTDMLITREYSFSGFTRLEISDGFDVNIAQGEEYQVSTSLEESVVPHIIIEQNGDTLSLMLNPDKSYNMVNITMDVDIQMSELYEIVLKDGADVTIRGLSGYESEVDFLSNLVQE